MIYNVSLESIQFQSTDLFKGIVTCIKDIRKLSPRLNEKVYYGSKEVKDLSAVIKKYTGLTFVFEDSNEGPSVYAPRLDQTIFDNVAILEMRASMNSGFDLNYDLKRMLSSLGKDLIKGTVSLKDSKVTGDLAEIECKMFLPRNYIYWPKALDEELAAIVLHEIGHVFTHFEYLTRSTTTNQSLALMLRLSDKTDSYTDKKLLLGKIKEKMNLDSETVSMLEKETDKTNITTIFLQQSIKASKSELGKSVYDNTACEYLADQFATRHGAGKYLVTFTDKMSAFSSSKISAIDYFGSTSAKLIAVCTGSLLLFGLPAAIAASAVSLLVLLQMSIGFNKAYSELEVQDTYDNDYMRFSRIKHQMIQRLKDEGISPDERKMILEYIEEVDPIIKKNLSDENVKLRNKIAMFFSSEHKRDFEYMRLQKDLELLGNSDLFVMSEKLKLV